MVTAVLITTLNSARCDGQHNKRTAGTTNLLNRRSPSPLAQHQHSWQNLVAATTHPFPLLLKMTFGFALNFKLARMDGQLFTSEPNVRYLVDSSKNRAPTVTAVAHPV